MQTFLKLAVVTAIGLAALSSKAQPTPGSIQTGSAGQGVVYVNAHTLGPGTNSSSTTVIYNNINISGKAQLNYLILTNGIGYYTNTWAGPTNSVSVALSDPYDLNYASFTACQISGITGKSNQITSEKLLQIYNLSATNFDVTLGVGIVDGDFVTSHTITNGTLGMFWLRYTPAINGRTNVVFRQL